MTHAARLTLALLLVVLPASAQEVVLPDTPPSFDPAAMAAHLADYAAGPDVIRGREFRVFYLVSATGVLHSPFIPKTQLQVAGRTNLFRALERFRMEPGKFRGKETETLWSTTLKFEDSGSGETVIVIDGEPISPSSTSSDPEVDAPISAEEGSNTRENVGRIELDTGSRTTASAYPVAAVRTPTRASISAPPLPELVEGTTTPASISAPALSMDLNMVSLSFTEIFDGTIVATLLVEPDGSHGYPVRVESNVAPRFTADVIDAIRSTTATPGKVKGRAVRSLLEITVLCNGVKTAGGRTEQGMRIAQNAPIPVPEADAIAKDTVRVPVSESAMVEQESTIYEQIEAPTEPAAEEEKAVEPKVTEHHYEVPAPVAISAEGEEVEKIETGAAYDPAELSALMIFPEGTAEREREEYVVLNVHVTPEGKAGVVQVLSSSWEPMEEPAINAVRQLTFEPAKVNERPVESTLVITLRYTP